jgi:uncharacterized protein with PIN domain
MTILRFDLRNDAASPEYVLVALLRGEEGASALKAAMRAEPIGLASGILFTTYATLRSANGQGSRLEQLIAWLGAEFDGVIVFDEAHALATERTDLRFTQGLERAALKTAWAQRNAERRETGKKFGASMRMRRAVEGSFSGRGGSQSRTGRGEGGRGSRNRDDHER